MFESYYYYVVFYNVESVNQLNCRTDKVGIFSKFWLIQWRIQNVATCKHRINTALCVVLFTIIWSAMMLNHWW